MTWRAFIGGVLFLVPKQFAVKHCTRPCHAIHPISVGAWEGLASETTVMIGPRAISNFVEVHCLIASLFLYFIPSLPYVVWFQVVLYIIEKNQILYYFLIILELYYTKREHR